MTFKLSAVYSVSQQQLLEQQLLSRLQSWSAQWFGVALQLTAVEFNQQLFGSLAIPTATKHWLVGELSCYAEASFAEKVLKKLTDYTGVLLAEDVELVAKPYIMYVLADLANQLGTIDRNPSKQIAVALKLKINGCDLLLQLDATLLKRLANDTFPATVKVPIALTDALAMEVVNISVNLKSMPLRLQQITNIRRGSIIQLTQRVDKPLPLCVSGAAVFSGHLVAQNQQKAFYITSGTEERKK
jgi:flagellar motor switch/type III secretory pathway protein FliN